MQPKYKPGDLLFWKMQEHKCFFVIKEIKSNLYVYDIIEITYRERSSCEAELSIFSFENAEKHSTFIKLN